MFYTCKLFLLTILILKRLNHRSFVASFIVCLHKLAFSFAPTETVTSDAMFHKFILSTIYADIEDLNLL